MSRGRAILVIIVLLAVVLMADILVNSRQAVTNYVMAFEIISPDYEAWPTVGRRGDIDHPAAGVEQIVIRLNSGSVRVVGGAGQAVRGTHQVLIRGKTEAQAESYYEKAEVQVSEAEGVLVIEFVEPEFRPTPIPEVHCHLDLVVPAGVDVQVDSYAPVQIQDVDGDVEVIYTGDLWVWDVKGSLSVTYRGIRRGSADLRRIGGSVAVADGFFSPFELDTIGGDLTLNLIHGTSCRINGVAGDCNVWFEDARSVVITEPAGDVTAYGDGGSLTIDGLRGALDLTGKQTNARIIIAEGAGFDVAAELRHTALLSDFPLETTEEDATTSVRGRIGAGGHPIQANIVWGAFELLGSHRRGAIVAPPPPPPQQMPYLGPGQTPGSPPSKLRLM